MIDTAVLYLLYVLNKNMSFCVSIKDLNWIELMKCIQFEYGWFYSIFVVTAIDSGVWTKIQLYYGLKPQ